MTAAVLTPDLAARFADLALGHVRREYPNNLDHALAGPADAATPRALHPIFYGSFDWHSCVHGHWMLARLLRRFPDMRRGADIRALFDEQFTPETVAGECAYFAAADGARLQASLWLGLAAQARRGTGAAWTRSAGRARSRRLPTFIARTISRIPADRDLSGALGRAFQHRLRPAAGGGLRGGGGGSRAGGGSSRRGAPLVRRGRRLPGLGRAGRRRLPLARL